MTETISVTSRFDRDESIQNGIPALKGIPKGHKARRAMAAANVSSSCYKNSKRRGFVAIVFLFSSMMIIIPLLAATFGQVMKFNSLSGILMRQKYEQIAVLTAINESVGFLATSGIYNLLPDDALIDPSSSSELLVRGIYETIGRYTFLTNIYYMNYVISNDTFISDIFEFPPSRKTIEGEKHFLIRITINKNEAPSYRKETAVVIAPSGDLNELWRKEFYIF